MVNNKISEEVEVPQGVSITQEGDVLVFKGEKGEVTRIFNNPRVDVKYTDSKVIVFSEKGAKRDKAVLKSYVAHIKNAFNGVVEGFVYKLKICSGHFPMNVSINNNELQIKNFIGEKVPRVLVLKKGVDVKIDGSDITVTGADKELTGQVAADIEQTTRRPGFDRRIFQDGIYITSKAGKEI